MSRIDQALNVAAELARTTTTARPSAPVDATSPLEQYTLENRRSRSDSIVPAPASRPERTTLAKEESSSFRGSIGSADDSKLQARIVTGTSNIASIEQYRRLGAALHHAQAERKLQTVMVTSALPKDGKTLTVVNIALTLSESYARRVLMIDADMRSPGLHALLNVPNTCGLSDVLRDGHRDLPLVDVSPRLSLVTAGEAGGAPLAGLTSTRMEEVLDSASRRFDWVLVDTPPVGLLSDAQVLARLVGGVIFVVGAGSTPIAAVQRAIVELGSESILGFVLNRVDDSRIPAADYYGHYRRP
jgi:capsular exopolysaccharide synthesis family protein